MPLGVYRDAAVGELFVFSFCYYCDE